MAQPHAQQDLPSMTESSDEGDRASVTETNGTVARFEMAFDPNPGDRFVFGPPIRQRLPSLLFVGFATALAGATVLAHVGAGAPALHRYIVVEGRTPLAVVIFLAALATFVRSGLRGVIVTREGVETRALSMGFPRVQKFRWAQIDRVVLDHDAVLFELWNGTYERLPTVRRGEELVELLARVATAHGRAVTRLAR